MSSNILKILENTFKSKIVECKLTIADFLAFTPSGSHLNYRNTMADSDLKQTIATTYASIIFKPITSIEFLRTA